MAPRRDLEGKFVFKDFADFRPNLSPEEILRLGSFGGGYYRDIYSSVIRESLSGVWKDDLPKAWLKGIDPTGCIHNSVYNKNVNRYKVKCGSSLEDWEESGWITPVDPYGWFQWYVRFFQGRRCYDDARQVLRAVKVMGDSSGRFRTNLINKILKNGGAESVDDASISPVIRQTLQHWGYRVTLHDVLLQKEKKR